MARGWVLVDSEIAAIELPDDLKTLSLAMASEKALDLTSDRENILLSSAHEIELYIGRMVFLGLGGAARECTSVLEIDADLTHDVPAIPNLPNSHPLTVTDVELWDDSVGFVAAPYILRPLGSIRVEHSGTYRIVCLATPSTTYPPTIAEAVARLFAYREQHKPRFNESDYSSGNAPSITGAMMRSGAAECLRFNRNLGV